MRDGKHRTIRLEFIRLLVTRNNLSSDSDSAHSVVGQEFDKVVVVLDDSFKYNTNGELCANNAYYSQRQMLYQIITRTRKQLYLIIINNSMMLNRIIEITSH